MPRGYESLQENHRGVRYWATTLGVCALVFIFGGAALYWGLHKNKGIEATVLARRVLPHIEDFPKSWKSKAQLQIGIETTKLTGPLVPQCLEDQRKILEKQQGRDTQSFFQSANNHQAVRGTALVISTQDAKQLANALGGTCFVNFGADIYQPDDAGVAAGIRQPAVSEIELPKTSVEAQGQRLDFGFNRGGVIHSATEDSVTLRKGGALVWLVFYAEDEPLNEKLRNQTITTVADRMQLELK
jgi:hypothetical protein